MNKIIALYSPAPQCGKSTLAGLIGGSIDNAQKISFATPIKKMAAALLYCLSGYSSEERVRIIQGDLKEKPLQILGNKSMRYVMQTLGTEWGRRLIDENIWVNIVRDEIILYTDLMNITPIIDDLRFPNEYEMLKDMGACLVKITRPGYVKEHDHPSDGALDDYPFDIELVNDGTPEEMYAQFKQMYQVWEAMQ